MTTFRTIRTSVFALAVAAVIGLASSDAQAQVAVHGQFGGGTYVGGGGGIPLHGGGIHGGGFHGGGIHQGGGFYGGGVGGWIQPADTWHDTSHWDYHPTEYVPHGNHLHAIPGHYDWHQAGHVDHNHF
jgi:hypothetical protein